MQWSLVAGGGIVVMQGIVIDARIVVLSLMLALSFHCCRIVMSLWHCHHSIVNMAWSLKIILKAATKMAGEIMVVRGRKANKDKDTEKIEQEQ